MSIILQGHIEVPPEDLEIVSEELIIHRQLTLEESGCIIFRVTQRADDPGIFDVYEEFESKDSFKAHQARVKSSRWGKVTVNVKRFYEVTGL